MPQHRRRLLSTTTAVLAATALLAGCSSAAKPDAKVTELIVPTAETPWSAGYTKIAQDYQKQTGVKIVFKTFPMDGLLTQESNAAQSGSNAFDIYQINEQWVGQFYDKKWVQPLTSVDPSFKWDPNLISFDGVGQWDAKERRTSPKGVAYSLPINGNIHLFMYRKDLYSKLGLSVPTTWDQVIANGKQAQAAKAVTDGYVARGQTPTYDFSALLFSYGGKWFQDEQGGNWNPATDSAQMRAALEEFKKLADIGPKSPQTIGQAQATSLMQGGTALQATLVAAVAAALENPGASTVAGKIGYAVLPGKTPASGTWTLGIPTGLPKDRAKAAYDFITWLTSKATMQKWEGYGGVITRSDVTSTRPEIKAIQASAKYIHGGLRYPFAPEMLQLTEPTIGQYLAGTISVDKAMSEITTGLTKIVKKAGFLK